jgi:uncharacterized protein (DUF934 family)
MVLDGAMPLPDISVTTSDTLSPVGIRFERFSDGRGFSLARHLREVSGFTGPLVARGHLIPDQADFLRRCGFSFVEINPVDADQWKRSLRMSPPAKQNVLSFQRSRREAGARE